METVDLKGEPEWEELEIPKSFGEGRSFVSGEPGGDRLRIRYFRPPLKDRLWGRVWFGPGAEGPPAHAHGGAAAAVLDEVMGTGCWLAGHPVLAAKITIDFRASVPLYEVHTAESWVERSEGRKVYTKSRLTTRDGTLLTAGEGLFVEIGRERFLAMKDAGLEQPGGKHFGTFKPSGS